MRTLSKLATLFSSIAICHSALAADSDPGPGKTHLMIGQIYQEEYVNFINQVGLEPNGASLYGTFYNGSFEQGSGMGFLSYVENNYPGSKVVAAMSFKDNPSGGGYSDVNAGLRATANGQEDSSIESYINIFQAHPNTTFLLRIGYEVNSLYTGMDAEAYKTSYRRIADRIREANINNVEFVYHPVRNFSDVEAFYPGKDYVDWFALSIFNHDVCLPNVSFAEWCRGRSVEIDVETSFNWAKNQGFPLLIAESAAQAPSNESASGFNDYLALLDRLVDQFDVRALVYINSDWRNFGHDPNFTDSRVQKFPSTQQFWVNNFGAGSRYQYYGTENPPSLTPEPSINPSPEPTPRPSNPSDGNYGVDIVDNNTALYWANNQDNFPSSGDYYMCQNQEQNCERASLNNGRWEFSFNNMEQGQSYTAVLKVPGLGQDDNPTWTFTWDGTQTPVVTPRPTPSATPRPTPAATPRPTPTATPTPAITPRPTPAATLRPTPRPTVPQPAADRPATTTPNCVDNSINFNNAVLGPFADQDVRGNRYIYDDGCTLVLTGNSWKLANRITHSMKLSTVLEFEYYSESPGEIQGILFDTINPETGNGGKTFNLSGTDDWGIRDYTYTQTGTYQTMRIPVGLYFGGNTMYIGFANDDDANSSAITHFRNVRLID